MKYAYIFGSNSFIVPQGSISYTYNGQSTSFLSIRSVYHDTAAESRLSVNIDIKDMHGAELKITDNKIENGTGFNLTVQRDRVLVTGTDGLAIIDVHQLDDRSAMSLEHNVVAELEVHAPVAPIRVRGNFMLGDLHVEIDNEKLFINDNSYANSTLAGHSDLQFTAAGVVL